MRYTYLIREVAHDAGAMLIDGKHDITGDDRCFTDDGSRAMAALVVNALAANPTIRAAIWR